MGLTYFTHQIIIIKAGNSMLCSNDARLILSNYKLTCLHGVKHLMEKNAKLINVRRDLF